MKRLLILCLLFTCSKLVASTEWNVGSIVLNSREVKAGELSVDARLNLVLFRNGDRVEVYAAHRIEAVQYFDPKTNVNRKFISVVDAAVGSRVASLYEVVVSGEASVLRKPSNIPHRRLSDGYDYSYYIRVNEVLYPIQSFRGKVYPVLISKAGSEFTASVQRQRMNPNQPSDAIRIIEYFNTLQEEILARN